MGVGTALKHGHKLPGFDPCSEIIIVSIYKNALFLLLLRNKAFFAFQGGFQPESSRISF